VKKSGGCQLDGELINNVMPRGSGRPPSERAPIRQPPPPPPRPTKATPIGKDEEMPPAAANTTSYGMVGAMDSQTPVAEKIPPGSQPQM